MTYDNQTYESQSVEGGPVLPEKASGMAITALILGILGLPCCCGMTGLGWVLGIIAIVIGFMENGKIGRGETSSKGKAMAMIGIVLGFIDVLLGCLQILWIIFWGGLGVLQGLAGSH